MDDDEKKKDVNTRATGWIKRGSTPTVKGVRKVWRPKKLHRSAARKTARMMDNQLRLTTGQGLCRFKKVVDSYTWNHWSRPFLIRVMTLMCVCVVGGVGGGGWVHHYLTHCVYLWFDACSC